MAKMLMTSRIRQENAFERALAAEADPIGKLVRGKPLGFGVWLKLEATERGVVAGLHREQGEDGFGVRWIKLPRVPAARIEEVKASLPSYYPYDDVVRDAFHAHVMSQVFSFRSQIAHIEKDLRGECRPARLPRKSAAADHAPERHFAAGPSL